VDPAELRLEKIRNALALAERLGQLHARLHVALIVVAASGLLTIVGASLAGQVPWGATFSMGLGLSVVVAVGLVRIAGLRGSLLIAHDEADAAIDNLISEEGEDDHDEQAANPG
jgi:hypothetical protein